MDKENPRLTTSCPLPVKAAENLFASTLEGNDTHSSARYPSGQSAHKTGLMCIRKNITD